MTTDDWLLSLDRKPRRSQDSGSEDADAKNDPTEPSIPDADQGARGQALDLRPVPSKDGFLMAVRAAAKGEAHDDEWYHN